MATILRKTRRARKREREGRGLAAFAFGTGRARRLTAHDNYGAPCPVVCSSLVDKGKGTYTCGAVSIREDGAVAVRFVNERGETTGRCFRLHRTGGLE